MKSFAIKGDKTSDGLRGYVHHVFEDKFKIENNKRIFENRVHFYYYISGERYITEYYTEDGDCKLRQWTEVNDEGQLVGYDNFEGNNLVSSGKFVLDNEGRIIKKYYNRQLEETFEYNEDGNLIAVNYTSSGSRTLYEYDANNLIVKEISLTGSQSFINLFDSPDRTVSYFKYDQKGNIVEAENYNYVTKELLSIQKFTFNKYGDETQHIIYKADGSIAKVLKFEYEYENGGNWIARKAFNQAGIIFQEVERYIAYYEEFDLKRYADRKKNNQ